MSKMDSKIIISAPSTYMHTIADTIISTSTIKPDYEILTSIYNYAALTINNDDALVVDELEQIAAAVLAHAEFASEYTGFSTQDAVALILNAARWLHNEMWLLDIVGRDIQVINFNNDECHIKVNGYTQ